LRAKVCGSELRDVIPFDGKNAGCAIKQQNAKAIDIGRLRAATLEQRFGRHVVRSSLALDRVVACVGRPGTQIDQIQSTTDGAKDIFCFDIPVEKCPPGAALRGLWPT
jgi:hypothetical protein